MADKLAGTGFGRRIALAWSAFIAAAVLVASGAAAEVGYPQPAPHNYTAAELDALVGPVALYSDDLVAIVLAASTYPLQVVEAARFIDARATDPTVAPDDDWDESVLALTNYPEVLRMMSDDLDWTAALGEAFAYQQPDVLDAIQRFRALAEATNHLQSDRYQTVSNDGGLIAIAPTDPQVVYVPYYEPARVTSYYADPFLSYYPSGYPAYDYPYPAGYSFASGFFFGVTTAYVVNWNSRQLQVYRHGHAGHPYYRWNYYEPYYRRHTRHVDTPWVAGGTPRHPGSQLGARGDRQADRRDARDTPAAGDRRREQWRGLPRVPVSPPRVSGEQSRLRGNSDRPPQAREDALPARRHPDDASNNRARGTRTVAGTVGRSGAAAGGTPTRAARQVRTVPAADPPRTASAAAARPARPAPAAAPTRGMVPRASAQRESRARPGEPRSAEP